MANTALKLLAQKAKKRLSTAGQTICEKQSTKTTFAYLSQGSYAIVANKQMIEEDPLFDKVKKLLESEDVMNPLSELTDNKYFNSLNETEKERYIMDISKRYNEIKEYFLSHVQSE
jgi:hypothetical protein